MQMNGDEEAEKSLFLSEKSITIGNNVKQRKKRERERATDNTKR